MRIRRTGYGGESDGSCLQCTAGKYKDVVSNAACFGCPGGSNSPEGSVSVFDCQACPLGYYASETGCQKCPQNSTSPEASVGISACSCITGNEAPEGSAGQACTACVAGKFKAAGPGVCQPCPNLSSSDAAAGNLTDCKCNKVIRKTRPFLLPSSVYLYLSVTRKHKSPCTHARMRANAHEKIHIRLHRDTQDLLGDLVVNVLPENTTTKLVGNVLIVQQARTSQAQRRTRRVRAWRAPLENTAGNAGCKWSQRAVNALPIRIVLQQVQTF